MIAHFSFNNSLFIFTDTYQYLQKSRRHGSEIEDLKSNWAHTVLRRLKVNLEIIGQPSSENSLLFIGNHISYLDIPLLMAIAPRVSFVAKKELCHWPVFGAAAKKINTVFVQRENGSSRRSARKNIRRALNCGQRVAIFPSGTTCINEAKPWRKGAFEIAADLNIPIQPFRLNYHPRREVAYIDRDFFPWHLYKLSQLTEIQATIEFHNPVQITSPVKDCFHWQEWSRGLIHGLE